MGFCMSKFTSDQYKQEHGPVAEGLASSLRARRSLNSPGSRTQTPMRDATNEAMRDYEEQQAEMIDEVRGAFRTVEHIANFDWMLDSVKPHIPQGAKETSRKRLRHYLLKHVINKNYRSPIEEILWSGGRVLDVGCGSGTWCIEMAKEFPHATIFGIDTSSQFEFDIKTSDYKEVVAKMVQLLKPGGYIELVEQVLLIV
ncbi:hypothetical protein BC937DRAFT_89618 [Endogone sp. FLAS-F59071]|nr:hypothetical protein BC937DRAFT_89618 [Endogone sp. FLAS-F59071]|eukprot:RUS22345.1 hypothetical protein BC937DRAFT_89618 [Endogone sp. FLAS-F59071]